MTRAIILAAVAMLAHSFAQGDPTDIFTTVEGRLICNGQAVKLLTIGKLYNCILTVPVDLRDSFGKTARDYIVTGSSIEIGTASTLIARGHPSTTNQTGYGYSVRAAGQLSARFVIEEFRARANLGLGGSFLICAALGANACARYDLRGTQISAAQ
jgi:hypothetical protein